MENIKSQRGSTELQLNAWLIGSCVHIPFLPFPLPVTLGQSSRFSELKIGSLVGKKWLMKPTSDSQMRQQIEGGEPPGGGGMPVKAQQSGGAVITGSVLLVSERGVKSLALILIDHCHHPEKKLVGPGPWALGVASALTTMKSNLFALFLK